METNADRLHSLLLQVSDVLRTDEPEWSRSAARFVQRLEEAGTDRDLRQRVIRSVCWSFGSSVGCA